MWRASQGGPVDAALAKFANAVRARQANAIGAASIVLVTEIGTQLSKPGTGRYYAKAARTAGLADGGTARERASYQQRRVRNRKLNALRTFTARRLNSGGLGIGDISRSAVLRGLHRASKPGDPPAQDSGALKRSKFVERTARGARVGVAMAYAQPLEFGTTQAGRSRKVVILPRPFMRPALASSKAHLGDVFVSTLRGRA